MSLFVTTLLIPKTTSSSLNSIFWRNMPNKTEETEPMGKLRPRKKKKPGAGKTSSLCSAHLTEDDFMRPLNLGAVKMKRELKRDPSGVCVFPSRHISRDNCEEGVPSKKSREQRMVSRVTCHLQHVLEASIFYYFVACFWCSTFHQRAAGSTFLGRRVPGCQGVL